MAVKKLWMDFNKDTVPLIIEEIIKDESKYVDGLRFLISECDFSDVDDHNTLSRGKWLEKCKNYLENFYKNNPKEHGEIIEWQLVQDQYKFSSGQPPIDGLKPFLKFVEKKIQEHENKISEAGLVEENILAPFQDQPYYIESEGFWLYQDSAYQVTGEYSNVEKMLLILEFVDKERHKFEQLKNKFSGKKSEELKYERNRIPEEVRIAVWRRDQGKCASCGGRENLEYDHIVPVSKGGGNTARNIELLCQNCNRSKGNRIE